MPFKVLHVSATVLTNPRLYPVSVSCDCCRQLDQDHPHELLSDRKASQDKLISKLRDQGWSIVDKLSVEIQSTDPLFVVSYTQLAICPQCKVIVYDAVNH